VDHDGDVFVRQYQRLESSVLADLGHLTGLSGLALCPLNKWFLKPEDFVWVSRLTRLTHLSMEDCALDDDLHNSTALMPLTGLVSLGLHVRGVMLSLPTSQP
jgi:hypothetical protein